MKFRTTIVDALIDNQSRHSVEYTVTTHTSNEHVDAGTDDPVYLSIIGSKGNTSKHLADNEGDDREKGDIDVYKFRDSKNIGEFQCVFIEKTGTDGWLIEKVSKYKPSIIQ